MFTYEIGVLFSGHGRLRAEALRGLGHLQPEIGRMFGDIDAATGQNLKSSVLDVLTAKPALRVARIRELSEDEIAFFVYGVSVAAYQRLTRTGWQPSSLLGQSFGEIAAAVCSGAFTVREGAQIVAARQRALGAVEPYQGRIAAVAAGPAVTRALIAELAPERLSVAVENGPTETLISGSTDAVQRALDIAISRDIPGRTITSRWALHCAPLMSGAAAVFRRSISHLRARPVHVPVFSAILGRLVENGDNFADLLARGFTHPVPFARAVESAFSSSAVLDCSPLQCTRHYAAPSATAFWHVCSELAAVERLLRTSGEWSAAKTA